MIDLARWLRLQLADGELGGTQIIDAGALADTHTAQIERGPGSAYGLGWNIETDEEGTERWNHSGAFSVGAATAARLVPSERLGIVCPDQRGADRRPGGDHRGLPGARGDRIVGRGSLRPLA